MTIPNLGVTQLIQQPGIGNTIASGLGNLGQLMTQMEQMKQEKAKNDAYNAYMQELATASREGRESERAKAAKQAEQERLLGTALQQYLTPQQVTQQIPTFGGAVLPGFQVTGEQERSLPEILKTLPPELTASFVGNQTVQTTEQTREQRVAAKKAEAELRKFLTTVPPKARPTIEAMIAFERSGVNAANSQQGLMAIRDAANAVDPKVAAAYRQRYKQLAGMSDEDAYKNGVALDYGRARIALGLERNPNLPPPGSGTPTPTGRTPAEINKELTALGPQVTTQRMLTREATARPAALQIGRTGLPRIPRTAADSLAEQTFRADSAAAANELNRLIETQRALTAELQQAQGAPAGSLLNPQGGITVVPPSPTEVIGLDPQSGRRIATDTVTGQRRYLDPPR